MRIVFEEFLEQELSLLDHRIESEELEDTKEEMRTLKKELKAQREENIRNIIALQKARKRHG